jgi:hypothetical protein
MDALRKAGMESDTEALTRSRPSDSVLKSLAAEARDSVGISRGLR